MISFISGDQVVYECIICLCRRKKPSTMSSSFPSPHSNCSIISEYFADLGWLSIQDKKTIVKRVYYGIDLVKRVISSIADLRFYLRRTHMT